MIAYLKSNAIKSAIYAFLLLATIAAAVKISVTSRKPKQTTAANNPLQAMQAAMPLPSPMPMDPKIFAFMKQNHLGPKGPRTALTRPADMSCPAKTSGPRLPSASTTPTISRILLPRPRTRNWLMYSNSVLDTVHD